MAGPLKEHQRLARGEAIDFGEKFGVESLESMCGGGGDRSNRHLKDHERGAGKPTGGNQSNPDHGPHK